MPKTGVGRNAPCPCGSGKKYKKCCRSKENQAQADYAAHHKHFGEVEVPADFSPWQVQAFLDRLDQLSNGAAEALKQGHLEKAESLGAELIEKYPDVIDGYWMRAQVCERQSRWQEAVEAYDTVLALIKAKRKAFDKSVCNDMRRARDAAARRVSENVSQS